MAIVFTREVEVVSGLENEAVVFEVVIPGLELVAPCFFSFTEVDPYVGPMPDYHPREGEPYHRNVKA
jgi:hypothetical protein